MLGLTPVAVENLIRSVRSHELFPFFEDEEIGSSEHHAGKAEFGSTPRDILRWNKWLDEHGAPSVAFKQAYILFQERPLPISSL